MRRGAIREQLFATAEDDGQRENADGVDEIVGKQGVNELGTSRFAG